MTTSMAPNDGDMERRVSFIEKSFEKLDAKLDRLIASNDAKFDRLVASHDAKFDRVIESLHAFQKDTNGRLARIEELLGTKASAAEVADLRGTVRVLPNIWQLITLVFGILAGAFAIVRFGLPHP